MMDNGISSPANNNGMRNSAFSLQRLNSESRLHLDTVVNDDDSSIYLFNEKGDGDDGGVHSNLDESESMFLTNIQTLVSAKRKLRCLIKSHNFISRLKQNIEDKILSDGDEQDVLE